MKIKLISGKEYNLTYEELLSENNSVINFYKKNYSVIFDTNHIMPAFFENAYGERLMEVELPYSITEIQGYAFNNCVNLKKVKLNNGLETILNYAFNNCNSLEEVRIPFTIKTIQNGFCNCKNLKKVTFDAVPVINQKQENKAMTFSEAIKSVSVVSPEYQLNCAFENCENLEEIDIANIPRIDKNAFINCPNIKRIKLNIGENQNEKVEIVLDKDEEFFCIQKEKDSIVILTKINGKIHSRLISISKKKMNGFDFEVVLNDKGQAFENFEFFKDITDEKLKSNKYVAVNGQDFFSEDFVYSAEDVKKIKEKIEEIKKEVLYNSEGLSQKEIYARLVMSLAHRLEYDFVGSCIMYGGLGNLKELEKQIIDCKKVTNMNYEEYIISKIGINPTEIFKNPNNINIIIDIIKDYKCNSRTARALLTNKSVCYSNPEIIRNIAHELGIDVRYYSGVGHSWCQVCLDGQWYDDDFTLYLEQICNGKFESDIVKNNFLQGYKTIDGERKRAFIEDKVHKFRVTRNIEEEVGEGISSDYAKKILEDAENNYKAYQCSPEKRRGNTRND